jgi:hypothetical protein
VGDLLWRGCGSIESRSPKIQNFAGTGISQEVKLKDGFSPVKKKTGKDRKIGAISTVEQ